MTKLIKKNNVFKGAKSKILLVALCIFGLLFSYSCSCGKKAKYELQIITPSLTYQADATMFLYANADEVKKSIELKPNNVDLTIESITVDGVAKLTKADFDWTNNFLVSKQRVLKNNRHY